MLLLRAIVKKFKQLSLSYAQFSFFSFAQYLRRFMIHLNTHERRSVLCVYLYKYEHDKNTVVIMSHCQPSICPLLNKVMDSTNFETQRDGFI